MDPTLPLEVKCKRCRKVHVRSVRVIEPEKFSPNGTMSVMSQFWCPHCREINAVRYAFSRGKDGGVSVYIKARIEPVGMALLQGDEESD